MDLRNMGLDDYISSEDKDYSALVNLSDIVKVALHKLDPSLRPKVAESIDKKKKTILAERIETIDDFNSAKEMGFELFQGFFFCRTVMVSGKSISVSELRTIRLMQELHRPEVDFDLVKTLIKEDLNLS